MNSIQDRRANKLIDEGLEMSRSGENWVEFKRDMDMFTIKVKLYTDTTLAEYGMQSATATLTKELYMLKCWEAYNKLENIEHLMASCLYAQLVEELQSGVNLKRAAYDCHMTTEQARHYISENYGGLAKLRSKTR